MQEIIEVAKKHPIAIGVGALVVVLLVVKGGGSSANSSANAILAQQKTASQTDIAIAGSNAQQSMQRSALAADIWKTTIAANATVQVNQDKNQTALLLGMMNHQENNAQITDGYNVAMSTIAAKQALGAQALDSQITMNRDSSNAKLTALVDTLQLQKYQTDVTAANLPALLHSQEIQKQISGDTAAQLATINGQNAQAIAALNTSASRTVADTAASKQSNSDSMSWVSTIAGIAALFL
jgi:hypothetical protein